MRSHKTLIHIILYDFQNNKFNLKFPSGKELILIPESVMKVGKALWEYRTKLNATLARMRIKLNASKLYEMIPDQTTREIYQYNYFCPCHARVNTIKVLNTEVEVIQHFRNEKYVLVDSRRELIKETNSIYILQEDLLCFSADCREILDEHPLVENGFLILQVYCCYLKSYRQHKMFYFSYIGPSKLWIGE